MAVDAGVVVADAVHCDAGVVDEFVVSWRELAQQQAVVFAKLVAVADATPVAEFAPFEISAAVALTRQAATSQLDLAVDVVRRLPDVHAAMARGDLDQPKARVIRDAVATLELSLARRIAAAVLPVAPSLTTGQLRARLAKLVIEADPDAAAARHRARVRDRRVELQPTEDSCATLLGLDLPAASALAAANRINAMARAVKQAGDPRSLDQLRADTFLDLLLGNTTNGSHAGGAVELVATLDALAGLADKPGHLNGYGPVINDIARQVAEQQRNAPWHFTIHDDATGEFYTGTTRARPAGEPTPPSRTPDRPSAQRASDGATASPLRPNPKHPNASRAAAKPSTHDQPNTGRPNASRTTPAPGNRDRSDAGHTNTSRTTPAPGNRDRSDAGRPSASRANPASGMHGQADAGRRTVSRAGVASGGDFGDPGRRFPNAALARHVRARDRMCRAPGCRRPALQADLDHTIAYHRGGRTEPGNLGPLCRFHHRAKHQGRWRLWQISPGIFVWRSPLGKLYVVRPEPP